MNRAFRSSLVLPLLIAWLPADARAGVDVLAAKVVSKGLPNGSPFDAGVFSFGVSASGRFHVFASAATNVVAGVGSGGDSQIWWRDVKTGQTRIVSRDLAGYPADGFSSSPSVSDDGTRVAFETFATNLGFDPAGNRQVCIADLVAGTVRLCSKSTLGDPAIDDANSPQISGDGRFVVFSSDAGNLKPLVPQGPQIFVYDVEADSLGFASVNSSGFFANDVCYSPRVSRNGRFVAFLSNATNMPDDGGSATFRVILRDREDETTELISTSADGSVTDASVSCFAITPNARYLAFFSSTQGLVPGTFAPGTAGYVVDRKKDTIKRFEAKFSTMVNESPIVLSMSSDANRLAVTTSFLPGGAILPQRHGHVYDRAKKHHLLVATTDEPSQSAAEDVDVLHMRGNGATVYFLSSEFEFDLLGSVSDQVLALNLDSL